MSPFPEIDECGERVHMIGSMGKEVSYLPQGVRSLSPKFLEVPALAGAPKEKEAVENSINIEMSLSSAVLVETSRSEKGI